MSVDGEILADLKRLTYLQPPTALFFLVIGPDGSGKSSILRSIFNCAPDYHIEVLHSPKDCFVSTYSSSCTSPFAVKSPNASSSCSTPAAHSSSLSLFYANFYDLQQLCEEVRPKMVGEDLSQSQVQEERKSSCCTSTRESGHLREGLIVLMDDLQSMWEFAAWHGFTSKLFQFIQSLRSTPRGAFVTTAVSEKKLPVLISSIAQFVPYYVPFPMTTPSSRLYLRPLMIPPLRLEVEENEKKVRGEIERALINSEFKKSEQERMKSTLCRLLPLCIQPTTTKRTLLMAFCMGCLYIVECQKRMENGSSLSCSRSTHDCSCDLCYRKLHETKLTLKNYLRFVETGVKRREDVLIEGEELPSCKSEERDDLLLSTAPPSVPINSTTTTVPQQNVGTSSPSEGNVLYGLESILDRLLMIVKIFLVQNQNELSSLSAHGSSSNICPIKRGPLLAEMPSTTGVLLHGPSGCGKSALTHQLRRKFPYVSFFFVRCSSLFAKYLGESERRLREVYSNARAASPAIVVLDEIDVIALSRGAMRSGEDTDSNAGNTGANVSKRMLAALLCELDGLTSNNGVLTIGTTNVPHVIDPAMLRQGRLETLIFVPPLTFDGAEQMTTAFIRHFKEEASISSKELGSVNNGDHKQALVKKIASATEGCTPACLEYVLRQVVEQCVLPAFSSEIQEHDSTSSFTLPPIAVIESILENSRLSGLVKPVECFNSLLTI